MDSVLSLDYGLDQGFGSRLNFGFDSRLRA
jgi:hypothetical protein